MYYLFECTTYYIFVYDESKYEMISYFEVTSTSLNLNDAIISSDFAYYVGYFQSAGNKIAHISKTPVSAILAQPNIYTSTASTLSLDTSTLSVVSETVSAVSLATSSTSSTTAFTEDSTTFSFPHSSMAVSSASYWLEDVAISVDRKEKKEVSLDLTCTVTGTTPITYSLQQHQVFTLPSWVTLDGTTKKLIIDAPDISTTSIFMFNVISTTGSLSYPKLITLTVNYVADPPVIVPPATGSNMTSNTTVPEEREVEPEIEASAILTQSAIGTGVAASVTSSFLSSSSSQSVWSLINQFQLFLLLNLIGANLHQHVKDYLVGMEFSTFSFSFLSFDSINFIDEFYNYFACEEEDEDYVLVGIEYTCTFINHLQFFLILLGTLCMHVIVIMLYKKYKLNKNLAGRTVNRTYKYFTFTVYVRMLLEAYLFLFLSVMAEIYDAEFTTGGRVFTYIFSILLLIILLVACGFVFYMWRLSLKPTFDLENSKFGELFDGLKKGKLQQLLQFVFVFRRIL